MTKIDSNKEVNKWTKEFLKNRLKQRKISRKEIKEMFHLSTYFPPEENNFKKKPIKKTINQKHLVI